MSILKSFDLKRKDREEKLEDFNFLFKKKRSGGNTTKRRGDLVTLGLTTVSIRPEVAQSYNIKKGSYAALILDDKKVGLVVRDKADPELYAVQGGDEKRHSFHINVPKASREFIKNFLGEYEVSGSRTIEGKYLILDLVKLKNDE